MCVWCVVGVVCVLICVCVCRCGVWCVMCCVVSLSLCGGGVGVVCVGGV